MGKRGIMAALALALLAVGPSPGQNKSVNELTGEVKQHVAADYDRLEALYKHLHSNPELSLREARTSARLARELKEIGFDVTEGVGGYGLVGVLKNGDGRCHARLWPRHAHDLALTNGLHSREFPLIVRLHFGTAVLLLVKHIQHRHAHR
jgi:hypothetical protein